MKKGIWLCAISAALAGCSGGDNVREVLGINRSAPDEFAVVSRPPLSVPPDFRLVTPKPGAPPRNVASASDRAAGILLNKGEEASQTRLGQFNLNLDLGGLDEFSPQADTSVAPVMSSSLDSAADAHFLSLAGADQADENIRSKLSVATPEEEISKTDSPFALQEWLGLKGGEEVVDPAAEAARIRENLDAKKPVNEGEVKTQSETPSTLDLLF